MQNLSIPGLINARDLGGLATVDGKRIRHRRLIRADALYNLSKVGKASLLRDYDLKAVVDLRTETERREKPDPVIPDVDYLELPLFEESAAGITREEGSSSQLTSVPDMRLLYRHMVSDDYSVRQVAKVIRTIMAVEDGGVLFHCTAGKDRTGVIAMLLLGILGVSEDDILEDYIYTNATGADIAYSYSNMVYQKTGDAALAERIKKAFLADEEYLKVAMSVVSERGGYEQFFQDQLNISADEIMAYRAKMLIG